MNDLDIVIFLALSFIIVFLIVYIVIRDKEIEKKFLMISATLDSINRELYNLEKKVYSKEKEKIMSKQLEELLNNLANNLNSMKISQNEELAVLYNKISHLEERIKYLSLPKFDNNFNNKKEIKSRIKEYKSIGYSVEEIAKELDISVGEVQLILNLERDS